MSKSVLLLLVISAAVCAVGFASANESPSNTTTTEASTATAATTTTATTITSTSATPTTTRVATSTMTPTTTTAAPAPPPTFPPTPVVSFRISFARGVDISAFGANLTAWASLAAGRPSNVSVTYIEERGSSQLSAGVDVVVALRGSDARFAASAFSELSVEGRRQRFGIAYMCALRPPPPPAPLPVATGGASATTVAPPRTGIAVGTVMFCDVAGTGEVNDYEVTLFVIVIVVVVVIVAVVVYHRHTATREGDGGSSAAGATSASRRAAYAPGSTEMSGRGAANNDEEDGMGIAHVRGATAVELGQSRW